MRKIPENEGENHYGWEGADSTADHDYTFPIIRALISGQELDILDAGCGNGYISSRLTALGHNVLGVDLAEDGIEIARKAHPETRYQVHSVVQDFKEVTPEVDVVVSSEVIEHLYSPQKFVANVYDIVRPGGYVILTTPYHGYLKNLLLSIFNHWDQHHHSQWEGGHIKFFSEKTLSSMLKEEGFVNVTFHNVGRVRWIWKSMVCRAYKPSHPTR